MGGTYVGGVWMSDDRGETWRHLQVTDDDGRTWADACR
jgi:hypothetical protein